MTGGGARGLRLRGPGGSPAAVGEREGGVGNLTPYLDLAEERRRRPATKRRGGGGPAMRCAVAEGNRRSRARVGGGVEVGEARRGGVEERGGPERRAQLEP